MATLDNNNLGCVLLATGPIEALHKDIADAFDYARTHKIILNQADKASQRTFCKKVYDVLLRRFVQGSYVVEKTKKKLNTWMATDNISLLAGTSTYAYSILCDIDSRFSHPIPLSQLPSCKKLLSIENNLLEEAIKELCDIF